MEMGRDSASSAQSKRGGGGKTARLRSSWGVLGHTSGGGGLDGERGVSTVVDGINNDRAGVCNAGGSETVSFQGFWDRLGSWNVLWGCSSVSPSVLRPSRAVVCGSEWDSAGGNTVVDDVAVRVGA
jgi:hypothetical protein